MTFLGTSDEEDAEKRGTLGSLKSESSNYSGTESCRPTRGWNRPGLRLGVKSPSVFDGVYCILNLRVHSRLGGPRSRNLRIGSPPMLIARGTGSTANRWAAKGIALRLDIKIRTANLKDANGIARVARRTWEDTYASIILPVIQKRFLEQWYTPDALIKAMGLSESWFYVATYKDEVVGFAQFIMRKELRGELTRIYIQPEMQQRGDR
jgi:hypothetical protein